MSKPKALDERTLVKYYIPASLKFRLDSLLFSPAQGKVPHGAYSTFHEALVKEALERFSNKQLREIYGLGDQAKGVTK